MAVLTGPTEAVAPSAAGRAMIASSASAARRAMIDGQLRVSGISDATVLERFAQTPREDYVPAQFRAVAYMDRAVPLGDGKTLAPALTHALMLSEARPSVDDRVLLIDGGSGYLASLLGPLVGSVHAIGPEHALEPDGASPAGGFSLLLIDGAIETLPDALVDRLADDGRVVTGLIDRGVSRLAVGRKAAGTVGFLTLGEIDLAPLAEFAAPRQWSF
jgi:protein-L-isoaspartate(D-aspartate) O-methyltransferase